MSRPDIRYARAPGGVSIAYERFGSGDSVIVMGGGQLPFEAAWEEPVYTRFLERLGEVSRVVRYDRRGTGLSDSPTSAEPYAFEQAATDFVAVLDRERVDRASIVALAGGDSGNALACAATHPSRVDRLVLMHPTTRYDRMRSEFGTASPREALDDRRWKTGEAYRTLFFPSRADDERFVDWFLRWRRRVATPATLTTMNLALQANDLSVLLPSVRAPTLVMRRADCAWAPSAESLRELVSVMPDARYVEVPGVDHYGYVGDVDSVLERINDFVFGAWAKPVSDDRVFAAVLFTDIVESTPRTAELGDRRWSEMLDVHDDVVRGRLADFRGRLVKGTGDGILATFDGPARAVRCARSLQEEMRRAGLEIRTGIHAGEVESRGEDVAGIAVNIARRVCDSARPGDVLVSRTVVDLVAGSGLEFDERGEHELKGVPGAWLLYALRS